MSDERALRVVVEAQLVLRMFVVPLDRPDYEPPTRIMLRFVGTPKLVWLWTPEILEDYRDGAAEMAATARFRARAEYDHEGFELLEALFYVTPPVRVTADTLAAARARISQSERARERDMDDAIYLACAVDGQADVVASGDQSILSLGEEYEGVRILDAFGLRERLLALNEPVP